MGKDNGDQAPDIVVIFYDKANTLLFQIEPPGEKLAPFYWAGGDAAGRGA
ncbi:hypothetical protein PV772_01430 [Pseudarthrobacter sp. CC12]